jgi:hypothetical protein
LEEKSQQGLLLGLESEDDDHYHGEEFIHLDSKVDTNCDTPLVTKIKKMTHRELTGAIGMSLATLRGITMFDGMNSNHDERQQMIQSIWMNESFQRRLYQLMSSKGAHDADYLTPEGRQRMRTRGRYRK